MESAVSAAVSTYVGRDKGNIKEIDLQLDSDGHVGISLDLETLDAALNYLTAKEAALDAKLLDLRETSAKAAAAELPELRARSAALVATGRELDALAADLAASSSAAAASSATLRGVHEERERVLQAAHMVDELLGLEECAGEVDAALGRGEYSAAVARVSRRSPAPLLPPRPRVKPRSSRQPSAATARERAHARRRWSNLCASASPPSSRAFQPAALTSVPSAASRS